MTGLHCHLPPGLLPPLDSAPAFGHPDGFGVTHTWGTAPVATSRPSLSRWVTWSEASRLSASVSLSVVRVLYIPPTRCGDREPRVLPSESPGAGVARRSQGRRGRGEEVRGFQRPPEPGVGSRDSLTEDSLTGGRSSFDGGGRGGGGD